MLQVQDGYFEGGTAQNIEVGFIPHFVMFMNLTEATEEFYMKVGNDIIRFDDGDAGEIKPGYTVQAADGGWKGVVREVILTDGNWSIGGGAAGYLVLEPGSLEGGGNLTDNDVIRVAKHKGETPAGDWGDLNTAANYGRGYSVIGEVAFDTTITPYFGASGSNAKGFTLAAGFCSANDLIYYIAFGGGAG